MLKLQLPDVMTRPIRVSFDRTPQRAYTGPRDAGESPQVAAFLDSVVERLSPLPDETRADVRAELSAHLEASIAAHDEFDGDRAAAITAAIQQLGEPRTIARRFRRAWDSTTLETPWPAMREALRLFWLAAVIYFAGEALNSFVILRFVRIHFGYEPFNFCLFFWFSGALVVLPLLAGARVGWEFPRRGARGTFFALTLSTVATSPHYLICVKYCEVHPTEASALCRHPGPFFWFCVCLFLTPGFLISLPLGTIAAIVSGHLKRHLTAKYRRPSDGSRFA